jgi:HEAT repeat protein
MTLTGIVFVASVAAATFRVCAVAHPGGQSPSAPAAQAQQSSSSGQAAQAPVPHSPERAHAEMPAAKPGSAQEPSNTPTPAAKLLPLRERAWTTLRDGLNDKSPEKRAKAVHALGLLKDSSEAQKAATEALKDEKGSVRGAAATALGSMHAVRATPELKVALDDQEPEVVLAAANSLLLLKNTSSAYSVYYRVLTGDRRTDKGLVRENLKIFQDRKKLIQMGVEQGIGFIPFAGFGYDAYKTVVKTDGSPVRAAAAEKLAHDPSVETSRALLRATHDKSWMVRAAALEAISERGDKSLTEKLFLSLEDEKDDVRYIAAACIAHLSDLPAKHHAGVSAKLTDASN